MRKLYTTLIAVIMTLTATAQTTPTKMKVNLSNGTSQTFNIADIADVTFEGEEGGGEVTPPTPTVQGVVEIEIPEITSYSESKVYKVMLGETKIAEICLEYINTIDAQRLVIYPVDAQGKAILTKGFSLADGGSVVWNTSANTVTYTAGSDTPIPVVYYIDGNFAWEPNADELESSEVVEDVIVDKRGLLETNTYGIVKIGTQYWMAENLRAKYMTDGTSIPMYKGTQAEEWKGLTKPAYHIIYDDVDDEYGIFTAYGCMYNGYTVKSDKIAPEGWAITSADDWTTLKTYLGSGGGGKIRSTDAAVWNSGVTATNLSGLNIPGGGLFNPAGDGDDRLGEQVYYWTTTKGTNLAGQESDSYLKCMFMNKTSVINVTANHTFEFGHYIRCIRK